MTEPKHVLFVCLGNICRSPLAEGVFQHLVEEAGALARYRLDSAGTSAYHAGELADERMRGTARRNGIELTSRSRKVRDDDYEAFDLILAMDAENHRNLLARCPEAHRAKVRMMREWDPEGNGDVPDPYYGGARGFDQVFEIVMRSCRRLLDDLEQARA